MATCSIGSNDDFRTMSYGLPHQNMIRYAQQQWDNIVKYVSDSSFIENAKAIASRYFSDSAIANARAILNVTGQIMNDPNAIYAIQSIEDCRVASLTMQRWIMAMPEMRAMEKEQSIYAYADTYVNFDPEAKATEHMDYLRVMNGIVEFNKDEDSEIDWYVTEYFHGGWDSEHEMSTLEQFEVLDVWDFVRNVLATSKDDPTNPFGGER